MTISANSLYLFPLFCSQGFKTFLQSLLLCDELFSMILHVLYGLFLLVQLSLQSFKLTTSQKSLY